MLKNVFFPEKIIENLLSKQVSLGNNLFDISKSKRNLILGYYTPLYHFKCSRVPTVDSFAVIFSLFLLFLKKKLFKQMLQINRIVEKSVCRVLKKSV